VNDWFNHLAAAKILIFGILVGAGLPALFAVALRLYLRGADATPRRRGRVLAGRVVFGLVVLAALVGVAFIARDFIGHQTGWYILGAVPK